MPWRTRWTVRARRESSVNAMTVMRRSATINGAPADVVALVRSINRQRRDYYKQIAQKENVSPAEVGKLYANKIYQSAPNGILVPDPIRVSGSESSNAFPVQHDIARGQRE